ncbi:amidase [Brytella acorum]|uniref:Amidase n=1 Tax=Brytella acorum TaxID=2959299 RepID=A0AA35Y1Z6_9PROT|nr:amidase [Brytella acorum]MDF3625231.1 amidase [Brytella acorum]CAI9119357.1 amidase [Brytella acorum]
MSATDFLALDAVALRDAILRREVSARALVTAALERAHAVQARLNPFVAIRDAGALAEAANADAALGGDAPAGPLHGVPVVIKDMTPTQGDVWTEGSRLFAGRVAERDALIVERLRRAGAIVIGKTTTPEFAWAGRTDSALWGITRNPWNPAHSCGGSSGGSAVAVATGCAPLGEGSDMGGSIRIPASACGIVGLKPGLGRIPFDGSANRFDPLAHWGPLSRSCRDAALFLDVTQSRYWHDIAGAPPPEDFLGALSESGAASPLRVALSVDLGCFTVDPAIEANLRAVAARLEGQGVVVEEVALAFPAEASAAWDREWDVWQAFMYGDAVPGCGDLLTRDVRGLIERGRDVRAVSYRQGEHVRTRMAQALQPVLERCDALLCPTLARDVPPAEGFYASAAPVDRKLNDTTMTGVFNLLARLPVLSMPSGFAPSGLPTGVQIVGRPGRELDVLRLGQKLEPCPRPPLRVERGA